MFALRKGCLTLGKSFLVSTLHCGRIQNWLQTISGIPILVDRLLTGNKSIDLKLFLDIMLSSIGKFLCI